MPPGPPARPARGRGGLRYTVVQREPYPVLRLSGVLDAAGGRRLAGEVAGCLAHQPSAVILDVTGLAVPDPAVLPPLAAMAAQARDWPGVPVAVCTTDPATRTLFEGAGVPVVDEPPGPPAPETTRWASRLQPVVGAARQARAMVTRVCERIGRPELSGPAGTVVTELVNNVVVHARTPMELILRARGRRLHVSVRDGSDSPPVARGPRTPTSPGGRGLLMVSAVAERWGYLRLEPGKVVWAVLDGE